MWCETGRTTLRNLREATEFYLETFMDRLCLHEFPTDIGSVPAELIDIRYIIPFDNIFYVLKLENRDKNTI